MKRSVFVMQATLALTACLVRASVNCRETFASMTASVTSSLAREPSAGEQGIRIVWVFVRVGNKSVVLSRD